MRRITHMKLFAMVGLVALSVLNGCGSASSNDQGTSVTFLGYFQAAGAGGGTGTLPAGLSGAYIRLGAEATEPGSVPTGAGPGPDGAFIGYVGFQNNLTKAGADVNRLELDFVIPGAFTNPPSTSVSVGSTMGPLRTTTTADPLTDSSLPPAYFNIPNRSFAQTFIVPSSVTAWINLNRAQLPEPPFMMEVIGRGKYVTTAGDVNVTNEQRLSISVLPETFVAPTEGSDDGTTGSVTGDESSSVLPETEGFDESTGSSDNTTGEDLSVTETETSGDL